MSFSLPTTSSPRELGSWLARSRPWPRRPTRFCFTTTAVICLVLFLGTVLSQRFSLPVPPRLRTLWRTSPILAAQSRTLGEARARYALRHNRAPPPKYDEWFRWAKSKGCLIDEYEQVRRDFEPFYQVAERNRTYFREMVKRGVDSISGNERPGGLANITIRNGQVYVDNDRTYWDNEWRDRLRGFAHVLPDMEVLANGNDEPRVVFDTTSLDARSKATNVRDGEPFMIKPKYTDRWFRERSGCSLWTGDAGFSSSLEDVGFIASASSSGFTTDLWPLLSFTKISPCFSDIMFPSQYHYAGSWYTGTIKSWDYTPWSAKQPKLYWRGSSNGGHIIGQNYRSFPRFRLVTIANAHPSLIDARISAFWGSHCTYECEAAPIEEEFDIGEKHKKPREAVFGYKYVLDVDGNTFSGRYLGLLKSGSLVFKSTAFTEHFSDWLIPYEHYIPVKVDLSDLVDRVQWAIDNDAEAHRIQQQGKRFAEEVITDAQNDCYWAAVLLEWARLWQMAEDS